MEKKYYGYINKNGEFVIRGCDVCMPDEQFYMISSEKSEKTDKHDIVCPKTPINQELR